MARTKPLTTSQKDRLPLHWRRSAIICERVAAVFRNVRLMEEDGPQLTRTCYRNHIESVLSDAACQFCRYLYAVVNGKRALAARHWARVEGALEYELPMALLNPVKDLKGWRSRQHSAEKLLPGVRAEMERHRLRLKQEYARHGDSAERGFHAYRLKKPLVVPANDHFEEFFRWAEDIVDETFHHERSIRMTVMIKPR